MCCERARQNHAGEEGWLTKTRSRRVPLQLDWTNAAQDSCGSRVQSARGETGDDSGCCNNGSERVTTASRVPIGKTRGASSNYLYCKPYAHSPSKKHRRDVDPLIIPTKEWSYRRRTGLAAYQAVLYACFPTQYPDEKQGEQLGWVVFRRTRRAGRLAELAQRGKVLAPFCTDGVIFPVAATLSKDGPENLG